MAQYSVTGKTADEIEELRHRYEVEEDHYVDFTEAYCLCPIEKQPDDYDGPPRFCSMADTSEVGDGLYRCRYHGGSADTSNLDKLAAMTHGLHALRKHIRETFDEKDAAVYDWIINKYPAAYDINIEESPADAYDLHRLAVEIVRAERGRGHILTEGEIHEEEKVGENGIVIDENGEVVTEKSSHYLARMLKDQDNKITKLQKELGISRKERQRAENADDAVEAVKNFAELGSAFLDRDDNEYDPDEFA